MNDVLKALHPNPSNNPHPPSPLLPATIQDDEARPAPTQTTQHLIQGLIENPPRWSIQKPQWRQKKAQPSITIDGPEREGIGVLRGKQKIMKNMKDLERMKAEKNIDKETLEFVVDEEKKIGEQLAELEGACLNGLIEPDLYDDYTEITMELRPAVGGSESSLFVEDVANMYLGYF